MRSPRRWPRAANRLLSRILTSLGLGSRLTLAEMRQLAEDAEAHERQLDDVYRRTRCPLLLLLGSRADPVPQGQAVRTAVRTAAERLRLSHPQVAVAWLDGGHVLQLHRPRELAELIIDFTGRAAFPWADIGAREPYACAAADAYRFEVVSGRYPRADRWSDIDVATLVADADVC